MFLYHGTRFYSCHVYHGLTWIVIPRTASALHAVSLSILYYEGPKSQCKKQCVTVADRLIPIHKAALCFRIGLYFFYLPSPSTIVYLFHACHECQSCNVHVPGLLGSRFLSRFATVLTSTGRCVNQIFFTTPMSVTWAVR